jgi:hypothetical protein
MRSRRLGCPFISTDSLRNPDEIRLSNNYTHSVANVIAQHSHDRGAVCPPAAQDCPLELASIAHRRQLILGICAAILTAFASIALAVTEFGSVECSPSHVRDHNPDIARVTDTLVCFEAYLSNFDTNRNSGDELGEKILGIPR